MFVSTMRAIADAGITRVRDFRDPTARVFLNAKALESVRKVERTARSGRETLSLGFARNGADLMALRTKTIDAAVCAAVAAGTRQVVILGAGFDGRAWRMNELAGVRVFEVDHPATQAEKRQNLDALPPSIGLVSFVPVDFERDSLDAALQRAEHDTTRPTCWIWEGVVMYLTRDAMLATLRNIASRSSPDSTLIVNYNTSTRRFGMGIILRLIGEPQRSAWSPEEIAADLRAAGFDAIDDSGVQDWANRFATGKVEVRGGRVMRIVVARRFR